MTLPQQQQQPLNMDASYHHHHTTRSLSHYTQLNNNQFNDRLYHIYQIQFSSCSSLKYAFLFPNIPIDKLKNEQQEQLIKYGFKRELQCFIMLSLFKFDICDLDVFRKEGLSIDCSFKYLCPLKLTTANVEFIVNIHNYYLSTIGKDKNNYMNIYSIFHSMIEDYKHLFILPIFTHKDGSRIPLDQISNSNSLNYWENTPMLTFHEFNQLLGIEYNVHEQEVMNLKQHFIQKLHSYFPHIESNQLFKYVRENQRNDNKIQQILSHIEKELQFTVAMTSYNQVPYVIESIDFVTNIHDGILLGQRASLIDHEWIEEDEDEDENEEDEDGEKGHHDRWNQRHQDDEIHNIDEYTRTTTTTTTTTRDENNEQSSQPPQPPPSQPPPHVLSTLSTPSTSIISFKDFYQKQWNYDIQDEYQPFIKVTNCEFRKTNELIMNYFNESITTMSTNATGNMTTTTTESTTTENTTITTHRKILLIPELTLWCPYLDMNIKTIIRLLNQRVIPHVISISRHVYVSLNEFENFINIQFENRDLLRIALTHMSSHRYINYNNNNNSGTSSHGNNSTTSNSHSTNHPTNNHPSSNNNHHFISATLTDNDNNNNNNNTTNNDSNNNNNNNNTNNNTNTTTTTYTTTNTTTERLEFLGDAILDMIISHFLFENFKTGNESFLSYHRSIMVKNSTLQQVAVNSLKIIDYMLYAPGQKNILIQSERALADTLEAVIGAMFLDRGLQTCAQFVKKFIILPFIETKFKKMKTFQKYALHSFEIPYLLEFKLNDQVLNHLKEFETLLGIEFHNKFLLLEALTHSSFKSEYIIKDSHINDYTFYKCNYERLEFLGDAILKFVTCIFLYMGFPNASEAQLAQTKHLTVDNTFSLPMASEPLKLLQYIRQNVGQVQSILVSDTFNTINTINTFNTSNTINTFNTLNSNTTTRSSYQHLLRIEKDLVSDVFEALIAAIYLDQFGFINTCCWIQHTSMNTTATTMNASMMMNTTTTTDTMSINSTTTTTTTNMTTFTDPNISYDSNITSSFKSYCPFVDISNQFIFKHLLQKRIEYINPETIQQPYKNQLQHLVQSLYSNTLPLYETQSLPLPQYEYYITTIWIHQMKIGMGEGLDRKESENEAARRALEYLKATTTMANGGGSSSSSIYDECNNKHMSQQDSHATTTHSLTCRHLLDTTLNPQQVTTSNTSSHVMKLRNSYYDHLLFKLNHNNNKDSEELLMESQHYEEELLKELLK
ncbi:hypothetical protein C9374_013374 [Naegleria lovaniensis]|uniref:Uncharacterized protein n=1 Tax=Naegleria lovaniensis TaxID=51637 RepID=A0AA88GWM1_NAELO|nr:uncharacterized protein C9374_013374 [Naegleria lovaniensis]KAG2391889.1 hypothetical protein C9374_013374 [Naegleria lovaniensis]